MTWVPTDLLGLLHLLRRYWRVVVFSAIAGVLGVLASLVVIGPGYVVTAKILVRLGPEIAPSPLLAARDGAQAMAGIRRAEDTLSVVEILTNPRLISATVASFGEAFFADHPPVTLWQHVKSVPKAALKIVRDAMRQATVLVGLRPPTTFMDRVVLAIGSGLRIEPVRRTDVIEVALSFPDPRAGEAILKRFIDLALADYVLANRMPGAVDFFADGVATRHAELRHAEQLLLSARKAGTPVWSSGEQRSLLLRAQSDLQVQHRLAVSAVAEADAEIAAAEAALAALPAEVEMSRVRARNPAIDDLRSRLVRLRMDYAGQRVRYGEGSPEVVELRRQIDILAEALAVEPEARVAEVTAGVSPAHQTLARDLTAKRILREGQVARAEQMASDIQRLEEDLEAVGASAIEIGRLEQEVTRLRRAVDLYEKGLDDSRIAQAMETVQLSGLRVVMPPTAETIPSSPSIRRGLLIGLIAGLGLSVVAVAGLEYLRTSRVAGQKVVTAGVPGPPDSQADA